MSALTGGFTWTPRPIAFVSGVVQIGDAASQIDLTSTLAVLVGARLSIGANSTSSVLVGSQSSLGGNTGSAVLIGTGSSVGANSTNCTIVGTATIGDSSASNAILGTSCTIGISSRSNLVAGDTATIGDSTSSSLLLGNDCSIGNVAGATIALGHNVTVGDNSSTCIVIGYLANVGLNSHGLAIGLGAGIGDTSNVITAVGAGAAIGSSCTYAISLGVANRIDNSVVCSSAIGMGSSCHHSNSQAYGVSAQTSQTDEIVFGGLTPTLPNQPANTGPLRLFHCFSTAPGGLELLRFDIDAIVNPLDSAMSLLHKNDSGVLVNTPVKIDPSTGALSVPIATPTNKVVYAKTFTLSYTDFNAMVGASGFVDFPLPFPLANTLLVSAAANLENNLSAGFTGPGITTAVLKAGSPGSAGLEALISSFSVITPTHVENNGSAPLGSDLSGTDLRVTLTVDSALNLLTQGAVSIVITYTLP